MSFIITICYLHMSQGTSQAIFQQREQCEVPLIEETNIKNSSLEELLMHMQVESSAIAHVAPKGVKTILDRAYSITTHQQRAVRIMFHPQSVYVALYSTSTFRHLHLHSSGLQFYMDVIM